MARPRKVAKNEEAELSVKEIWDVLEFSKSMVGGLYPGILTPDLISSRMKEISFSPSDLTEDEVTAALKDPKNHETELRSIVEYIEICSASFRRIAAYMASHLKFNINWTVRNVEKPEDYKKLKFKQDQQKVFDWLDRFNYQYHFRNVVKQVLRNEVYVCCVRNESERISLQELPLQYVKLTSKFDYGYLCSFDFAYFLQPGTDLDLWPDFFKRKFFELFGNRNNPQIYNPALPPELRGNSQFVYWVDLPPTVAWVFKFDSSITTAVPYLAALVPEFINQPIIRSLQKDINMAQASKMLVGQVPMLKDTKTKVSDMIAINPETLGKFLALVRSSISTAIKVASAPLEDMQSISFDGDDEMYGEYLHNAVSASGVNAPLVFSGKLKANAVESQLSFQSDSLLMEHNLYPQFNDFCNFFINRELKNYKYDFEFGGNSYYLDQQKEFDNTMQLLASGVVLPQKIASSLGMKPQTLYRMMEEAKGMGFIDMLTPIVPAFQQSGKDGGDGGRPKKKDSEASDSAQQTREDGGNEEKTKTAK